ncbi:substrate-binding domain-containing protein [Labilibacter sediminis]|nr:substrate-binding domain-containing protein [Labilibacter sediminis]
MNKKHTIKDIAKLAGVSTGTVDRVLHNRGRVSEEVKTKVNAILKEIDFQPNIIARSLKSNKIINIAVLLPDPKLDAFWSPCLKGIKKIQKEYKSFNVILKTYYFDPLDNQSFLNSSDLVISEKPDAVLFTPFFSKESKQILHQLNELNIVYGTFNNPIFSNAISNFTGPDLYKSGRVAARLMDLITKDGKIIILHIDENYENATYMQKKELGFRDYFNMKDESKNKILAYNLKHTELEKSIGSIFSEHSDICGLFITTSKAHQVINVISDDILKHLSIIGYDLLEDNIKLLKSNKLQFLINQNPEKMVYNGLLQLVEFFLIKKDIPQTNYIPIEIINSENFEYYV